MKCFDVNSKKEGAFHQLTVKVTGHVIYLVIFFIIIVLTIYFVMVAE